MQPNPLREILDAVIAAAVDETAAAYPVLRAALDGMTPGEIRKPMHAAPCACNDCSAWHGERRRRASQAFGRICATITVLAEEVATAQNWRELAELAAVAAPGQIKPEVWPDDQVVELVRSALQMRRDALTLAAAVVRS